MQFKESIGVYDRAFTADECDRLIKRHEYAINHNLAHEGGYGSLAQHKKSMDYDILGGSSMFKEDKELTGLIADRLNHFTSEYINDWNGYGEFNGQYLIEGQTYYPILQMQKYKANEGHFNTFHVENDRPETSTRLFVFILYLNDVEEGGETAFCFKEYGGSDFFKVKPKKGRLVIHPASWPYIHKGCMPVSNDKYILTTWACYGK
jgi:hypothetical protein|tara:strand:+ start:310 stop:927 length:618 start_codon:yes stop_codon:yes gene_type:complete